MATATASATTAQVAQQPFRFGTQPTVRNGGYNQTVTVATASGTQQLEDYQIAPTNILRTIFIEVAGTATGGTSVAFNGDGPMNILQTVNFQDAGGNSIVGSFDGYTLAMAMKYFGYSAAGDPRNNAVYSATSAGNFNFVIRIPVEAVSRTGVGSLMNQTTQSPFVLSLTVNTLTAVYSSAPTSLSVTVKVSLGGYWNGDNASASPTPKAFGSTQYVNRASIQALNGASQFQLPNNGLGNPVRNILFLNYGASGRSDTAFPDPLQITFRGINLAQYSKNLWKSEMSQWYGLTSPTIDSGTGLDTGVYTLPFNRDFGFLPGAELGLGYLQTNVGDEIQLIGTWNAASTLYELVNFISVKGAPNLAVGLA